MKIIQDKYPVDRMTMVSGLEQQSAIKTWDYAIDNDGNYWFWPSQHEEPGAMVHVGSILVGQRSEGYGGREMEFPTKDGVVKIQGPWHSNTDALYKQTGTDLRDKHRTIGVIALGRTSNENYETILTDVVYLDTDDGVVGTFGRIEELAQKMATESDRVLFYYRKSSGGTSCGPVYPSGWSEQKQRDYFNTNRSKR